MTAKSYQKKRFGDWALKFGFMTIEQIDYIISKQKITKQRLGQLCIEEGFIDNEKLAKLIAAQYAYQYVDLKGIKVPEIIHMVPLEIMTKYQFIPYEKKGDTLVIAISEPLNFLKAVDALEVLIDMDISIVIASINRIRELLKKVETSQSVLDTASDDMRLPIVRQSDKGEEILSFERVSAEESPIVKLVDSTILDAINKRASDIHIESSESGMIIRYRVDGMLHQATEPLDIRHQSPTISRIKVMSELDISEKRIPQDGRFKLKVMDRYIDFRVSILPTIFGEDAVIRILDKNSLVVDAGEFRLDSMGLPIKELEMMRRMIHAPYGMFLMTGPTGSGKTTTLYRALSEVNSKDVKIITIEDPVEYQIKGIVQIPVNIKKGLTFAKGLRSILRHDPDKILVGEIRDSETAQIALQSALTGHLVFTTVHANSSFEVVTRFMHMGIEPYNLIAALNCIAAQRLIRTLCHCKTKTSISEKELVESGIDFNLIKGRDFYTNNGCEDCKGTGFKGRKAIIELVVLNDDMREIFIKMASISVLKKKAAESGTIFLRKAAINEVLNRETTLREANRVSFIESNE
ncbi:MAG: Flp pilus assembly complex ATPase component TadA [Desulfobacteraceae bacterium]|nr:Flp pilus assembly complex ATPase component TadA [Desulfobacteraceae bacterium]MBC2718271.1 Flp pilus assembly complex ATPase component TadA [Desulfobacteraceae bacterium]